MNMRAMRESDGVAKPCRILRLLGRCEREHPCAFPLGLSGCFDRYDADVRDGKVRGPRIASMLGLLLELWEEKDENGKRVSLFDRRQWQLTGTYQPMSCPTMPTTTEVMMITDDSANIQFWALLLTCVPIIASLLAN